MAVSIDQQFIEYIVKSVVGHPDDVKIERRIDEKGVLLELLVNPEDLGRVIGKRGVTAQSLRTLLRALGTKNDARYNLKIIDTGYPEGKGPQSDDRAQKTPVEQATDGSTRSTSSGSATGQADNGQSQDDDQVTVSEPAAADDSAPADAPTDESAVSTAADDIDMAEDEELPETPSEHSDVVSRTRKELADLDDLDV